MFQLWDRWAQEQELKECKDFSLNNSFSFFQFNYNIKNLLELIYDRNLQNVVYDAFYIVMMPQSGNNALECYKSRFYSYGLLDCWMSGLSEVFMKAPKKSQSS